MFTWEIPGICIVCGRIWKRDILVADTEELENLNASEIHPRRLNPKEVLMPKSGENCTFPIADGTLKSSGGHQVFRKPTLIRDQPERCEERKDDLRGESDGSQPIDTMMDGSEAREDFRSLETN